MNTSIQIATHFRAVYFGGNWTDVNLKATLSDLTWQQATTPVHSFNTIATLVFHLNYYVEIVSKVLEGGELIGNDKLSFAHEPVNSQADWDKILAIFWQNGENFATLIEKTSEKQLYEVFSEEKYGTYFKNLQGMIEHTHYHLGQIVLIKKIVQNA